MSLGVGTRSSNWSAVPLLLCVLLLLMLGPVRSALAEDASGYDQLWGHAKLYESSHSDAFVKDFALSGRTHVDAYYFDDDEDTDDLIWRRFRFGFKSNLVNDWVVQLEAELDLNESSSDWYSRLTDAYVAWNPSDKLDLRMLKHSAGFTLDGATSSKKLLTLQRNNVTNNLWFTAEYFTGISAKGELDNGLQYRAGVFSSDGDEEISRFDAHHFVLSSLGYDFAGYWGINTALVRVDYVYNKEHTETNTREFTDVLTIASKWEGGSWGLWTDLSTGQGYGDQSDLIGFSVMPFYSMSPMLQAVARYTYLRSDEDNGVRHGRYERELTSGRGDEYREIYGGLNVFFYGHKLKWQTGLQYSRMEDSADDGGEYDGWGITTGLRVYW